MITLSDFIKELRVSGAYSFTVRQAVAALNSSPAHVIAAAYRLKKKGELMSPAKGLYCVIPPEFSHQGSLPATLLVPILMNHWGVRYYVGLLSAATYHGATHQKIGVFQVVTNKQLPRELVFGEVRIDCIYKKNIESVPVQNVVVSVGYLCVSTPEVTAMDLLLYPHRCGGLNHIATVLSELVEVLDPKKILALAKENASEKAWVQRLGYLLESIDSVEPDIQEKNIKSLKMYVQKQNMRYLPLATELRTDGFVRNKQWMIIENTSIESDL